ncbi:hypothetical protein [Actinomyces minihominis]|uniref:hypothetical protein n=1 Tax=Actinomyces minihominis TaxID=2002838 RepID=UPI000C068065|nr:hypothetical protein [Actinomyces minihominis]
MGLETALTGLIVTFTTLVGFLLLEAWRKSRQIMEGLEPGSRNGPTAGRVRWLQLRGGSHLNAPVDLASICVEVAAHLRAGSSVERAWQKSWEHATGVARVEISGGVPAQLEQMQGEAAAVLVAATRFSLLTGAPLVDVLFACGRSLNQLEEGLAAQKVAFTGPRLSARILSLLPVAGLIGGEVLGARPLSWFLSAPLPMACGLVGVVLALAGHLVSKRLIEAAARSERNALREPVLCDLTLAGLRGGASIPRVLESLGESTDEPAFIITANELLLGATWEEAWTPLPPAGALLRRVLQPAWEDGVAPAPLLKQAAEDARRRSVSATKEAAERLGVKLALPLGLLLLPSFILLGLLPVFFSLVGSQLSLGF